MRSLILAAALLATSAAAAPPDAIAARVARILRATPLIDGHNDWAESLREREGEGRWTIDLTRGLGEKAVPYNTDIARLRDGMVGGQFWSAWVSADLPPLDQVKETLEEIDLIRTIVARYPQIDNSFSVLRAYKAFGAGYLTLTHAKTIAWADSATDNPKHGGLTPFGEAVVHELNRLGMLVDLSHVNEDTMRDALRVTKAPVIFSHSGARGVDDHPRNVSDELLKLVAANGGVVMVNYSRSYVSDAYRHWAADEAAEKTRMNAPPYGGLYIGQPDKAAAALEAWHKAHPAPRVTLAQVADHIDHIVKVAGIDHVGLGSDYDGVSNSLPEGLESVATYPALFAELLRRGWSDADAAKLAGGNVLRVMEAAEKVAASMKSELPATATQPALDGGE
jgi:membrane dipeptidase